MRWWRVAMASGQELDRRCSAPASRERRRRPRGRWLWECARGTLDVRGTCHLRALIGKHRLGHT